MSESESINETDRRDDGRLPHDGPPDSYQHDPRWVPALAQAADAACDGVADPHEAALRVEALVRQADPDVPELAAAMLLNTFMYVIVAAPVEEQANAKLEPLNGPALFPPALRDASDDLRSLWVQLAPAVQHCVARARCWDIVFTMGLMPDRRDAAARAVRAYLDGMKERGLAPSDSRRDARGAHVNRRRRPHMSAEYDGQQIVVSICTGVGR
jgi:hypothetical protein